MHAVVNLVIKVKSNKVKRCLVYFPVNDVKLWRLPERYLTD